MDDLDWIFEPTEAEQTAENEAVERATEHEEANNSLYQRSYDELLKSGFSEDEAYTYYSHPDAVNYARQQLDAEAYEEFLQAYPGVKPEDIPVEAWQDFNTQGNLVKALERNEPFLKGFTADMPKTNYKRKVSKDPFEAGFDSVK